MKITRLPTRLPRRAERQPQLDLVVEKEAEIQGIGMGVLSDGTPFLTQRGLAQLCGVQNAHIGTISSEWNERIQKPRISSIKDLLSKHNVSLESPHIECKSGKRKIYAYTDRVCMAILEYYAFEAGSNCKEEAKENFRTLAGQAFREFIYTQVGYDPTGDVPVAWAQFRDRVSLVYDSVPIGYFSIFKEMSDMIVTLIRAGCKIGPEFVPDISVGVQWGKYWNLNGFDGRFGRRVNYQHEYPPYFPQAASNPQTPWAYPESALPEFRKWLRDEYIAKHLQGFLMRKEKDGLLPPSFSQIAIRELRKRNQQAAIETE